MCYFITVAATADKAEALRNVRKRGVDVSPYTNRHLTRQLPEGCQTFALTSGGCSCDLFSAGPISNGQGEGAVTRLRSNYQKKGWSQAKLERAIGNPGHRLRPRRGFLGLRPDIRDLLAELADQCGELAVAVHFYSGDIESEQTTLRKGPRISPAELREAKTAIGEDMIIWVIQPNPDESR